VSPSSLVTTERKNSDNSLNQTKECEINANGYITKMIFKNAAGAVIYTYDYTYDADGYLTKQKGTYASGITDETVYTIAGGNVVSAKIYYDNILNSSNEYTYDNTKLNKTTLGHTGYWQSYNLFGKRPKNLFAEVKVFNASGTVTYHSQTIYDMDADGYPVKETVNYLLNGKQSVTTYTYQ
jgi:hypothetical protein